MRDSAIVVGHDAAMGLGATRHLLGAALLAALVVAGCTRDPNSEVRPAPGELLHIEVATGARANASPKLLAQLAGAAAPSSVAIVAASCNNVAHWLSDDTLNNSIVVGANPRLVRVAELVGDDRVSARLALLVENKFLRGFAIDMGDEFSEQGFDAADLDEYLALVAEPPSSAAIDRYVVYAVSVTTTVVRVTYLDRREMPDPETVDRLDHQSIFVSLDDGLYEGRVDRNECEALQR